MIDHTVKNVVESRCKYLRKRIIINVSMRSIVSIEKEDANKINKKI